MSIPKEPANQDDSDAKSAKKLLGCDLLPSVEELHNLSVDIDDDDEFLEIVQDLVEELRRHVSVSRNRPFRFVYESFNYLERIAKMLVEVHHYTCSVVLCKTKNRYDRHLCLRDIVNTHFHALIIHPISWGYETNEKPLCVENGLEFSIFRPDCELKLRHARKRKRCNHDTTENKTPKKKTKMGFGDDLSALFTDVQR